MKQAMLITAYYDSEWLKEICDIWRSDFWVYVHVDAKSDISDACINELNKLDNVMCISSYSINWGSYRHILAILKLMELAINDGVEYVHILSANTIPIKKPSVIRDFFENNADKIYMKLDFNEDEVNLRQGFWYFEHIFNGRIGIGKVYGVIERNILRRIARIPIRKAKKLNCLSYVYSHLPVDAVKYIIEFNRKNPEFIEYLKWCYVSEELFFCNILYESEFRDKIVNNHMIYDIWSKDRGYPAFLEKEDIDSILGSDCLFARKVTSVQKELFGLIRNRMSF